VTVKKITWILAVVALFAVMAVPTLALANNGPHGGYVADTDMCAQCHRAHTAPSSLTWTDNQGGQKNALLLTDSPSTYLFCLACHDNASQGADTNVMGGVWQGAMQSGSTTTTLISGAFGSVDALKPAAYLYDSNGLAVTSTHLINSGSWGAYGGGLFGETSATITNGGNYVQLYGTGNKIVMDCTTCHDPHGSSNYRILKDAVNGVTVGGYTGGGQNPTPAPFVISNETGYPQTGFALHTLYPGYVANYTKAQYAKAPGGAIEKGMTGWCSGCHTTYNTTTSVYNSGDSFGNVTRHRHPMNVELAAYAGPSPIAVNSGLPLAHSTSEIGAVANSTTDWIECLSCHNAHGATTTMAGWSDLGNADVAEVVGSRGVLPTDSNLLKMNNRGVCEACHNK
jgi:predicted CXXCH cytochrome family protein